MKRSVIEADAARKAFLEIESAKNADDAMRTILKLIRDSRKEAIADCIGELAKYKKGGIDDIVYTLLKNIPIF